MISLARHTMLPLQAAVRQSASPMVAGRQSIAARSAAAPYSTAFRPSQVARFEDKNVDPTPGNRGGSEQSMPGEADVGTQKASESGHTSLTHLVLSSTG
jgi:hypothetical protein